MILFDPLRTTVIVYNKVNAIFRLMELGQGFLKSAHAVVAWVAGTFSSPHQGLKEFQLSSRKS
jgi:hypothetical protein